MRAPTGRCERDQVWERLAVTTADTSAGALDPVAVPVVPLPRRLPGRLNSTDLIWSAGLSSGHGEAPPWRSAG